MTRDPNDTAELSEWRAAHKRNHDAIVALGERLHEYEEIVNQLERTSDQQKALLQTLERRKIEASNIRFTPATVLAMLAFCASIIGGQKWSTWGLSDQIASVNAKMDALKQHDEDNVKLQDERAARMAKDIGDIKAQQAMQDLKMTNLREAMLTRGGK